MTDFLKKADRTLLELHTGMFFAGILCQAAGLAFAPDRLRYTESLWFGILIGIAGSLHMARTLDRAMLDGADSRKVITGGYVLRYTFLTVLMAAVAMTDVMDVLVTFMGYMTLKVAAYLQPITHKIYNRLFHETDPVPDMAPAEGELPETAEGGK